MEKNEENKNKVYDCLEGFYDISCMNRTDGSMEEKINNALKIIQKILGFDSGSIFIMNQETGTLEETATVGSRVDFMDPIQYSYGKDLSIWIEENRDSVLIPDVLMNGFRSFVSLPIKIEGKIIGVINLAHSNPDYFTGNNLRFLDIFVGQLTDIIERSLFLEQITKKNNALEETHAEIREQHERIVEMEKNQLIIQAAASLNHEINNPLTTVIGNIELLLLKGEGIDEKIEQKLRVILRESERIRDIVEKFRDIKKIVAEDYTSKFEKNNPDQSNNCY